MVGGLVVTDGAAIGTDREVEEEEGACIDCLMSLALGAEARLGTVDGAADEAGGGDSSTSISSESTTRVSFAFPLPLFFFGVSSLSSSSCSSEDEGSEDESEDSLVSTTFGSFFGTFLEGGGGDKARGRFLEVGFDSGKAEVDGFGWVGVVPSRGVRPGLLADFAPVKEDIVLEQGG